MTQHLQQQRQPCLSHLLFQRQVSKLCSSCNHVALAEQTELSEYHPGVCSWLQNSDTPVSAAPTPAAPPTSTPVTVHEAAKPSPESASTDPAAAQKPQPKSAAVRDRLAKSEHKRDEVKNVEHLESFCHKHSQMVYAGFLTSLLHRHQRKQRLCCRRCLLGRTRRWGHGMLTRRSLTNTLFQSLMASNAILRR